VATPAATARARPGSAPPVTTDAAGNASFSAPSAASRCRPATW
jgi:hypothetical protein